MAEGQDAAATAPSERQASEDQYRHRDGFDFVAASVKQCLTHLGPWTVGDLAFGMWAAACHLCCHDPYMAAELRLLWVAQLGARRRTQGGGVRL